MKAAISYFVDYAVTDVTVDGKTTQVTNEKILCTYNKIHGVWMLPGSDTRNGVRDSPGPLFETPEQAQARILMEETGLETVDRKLIYEGPNGYIFGVTVRGTSRGTAFLTREEFLARSPFRPFYEKKLFAHIDSQLANESRVVVKAKSGRALYAVQLESYRNNSEGELGWWLDPVEYIHAFDEPEARLTVGGWVGGMKQNPFRVVSIGLAIGFRVQQETSKGKILQA